MKKYVLTVLLLISFHHQCLASGKSEEGKNGEKSKEFEYIQAEIREWYTYGDSFFRISFFHPFWGRGESILEFNGIDAPITIATLRLRPGVYWLTFEGSYGEGNIDSGKQIDTDLWEDWRFEVSGWKDVWSESEADVDGDVTIIDTKMVLRLYPRKENPPYYLDLTAGYIYYREKLHMTNLDQTIPDLGRFEGLNQTYEFEWESYPIGLKANWKIINKPRPWVYGFYVNGSASAGPIKYRGEGVWNLRSDLAQDPSIRHEADEGFAIFLDANLNYQPIRYVTFGLGYQYYHFEAQNGTDMRFFADGSEYSGDLDKVKSLRQGPYASFPVQF